jgi:hypothetical protein
VVVTLRSLQGFEISKSLGSGRLGPINKTITTDMQVTYPSSMVRRRGSVGHRSVRCTTVGILLGCFRHDWYWIVAEHLVALRRVLLVEWRRHRYEFIVGELSASDMMRLEEVDDATVVVAVVAEVDK